MTVLQSENHYIEWANLTDTGDPASEKNCALLAFHIICGLYGNF